MREIELAYVTAPETNEERKEERKKRKMVEGTTVMNTNVFVRDFNRPFTDSENISLPCALHTLQIRDL